MFKKKYFGDRKGKTPVVQMLYKEAECENLQFVRPHLLQFIEKIVKSGFITSRLEPMISKGVTILSDKWFYFFIKSAE